MILTLFKLISRRLKTLLRAIIWQPQRQRELHRAQRSSDGHVQSRRRAKFADRPFTTRVVPLDGARLATFLFRVRDLLTVAREEGWSIKTTSVRTAFDLHPRISPAVRGQAATFPQKPFIVEADNVAVVGGSRFLIRGTDEIISAETSAFLSDESVSLKYQGAKRVAAGGIKIRMLHGPGNMIDAGIHAMHEYSYNYFHFVAEILPRILFCRERLLNSDMPLLIDDGLHQNILELLNIVDPHSAKIPLTRSKTYAVRNLAFPSDVSSIQDIYNRPRHSWECVLHTELIGQCVDRVLSARRPVGNGGKHERLYLRRGQRQRALVNEQEIEEYLTGLGFHLVDVDHLTLSDQVNLFRGARLIVGPTGAALTNIVWSKPEAVAVVLTSDHEAMPLDVWRQLAEVSACRVLFARGPQSVTDGRQLFIHNDYSVPTSVLAKTLAQI